MSAHCTPCTTSIRTWTVEFIIIHVPYCSCMLLRHTYSKRVFMRGCGCMCPHCQLLFVQTLNGPFTALCSFCAFRCISTVSTWLSYGNTTIILVVCALSDFHLWALGRVLIIFQYNLYVLCMRLWCPHRRQVITSFACIITYTCTFLKCFLCSNCIKAI